MEICAIKAELFLQDEGLEVGMHAVMIPRFTAISCKEAHECRAKSKVCGVCHRNKDHAGKFHGKRMRRHFVSAIWKHYHIPHDIRTVSIMNGCTYHRPRLKAQLRVIFFLGVIWSLQSADMGSTTIGKSSIMFMTTDPISRHAVSPPCPFNFLFQLNASGRHMEKPVHTSAMIQHCRGWRDIASQRITWD